MALGALGRAHCASSKDLEEETARCISWGRGGCSFREGHMLMSCCLRPGCWN